MNTTKKDAEPAVEVAAPTKAPAKKQPAQPVRTDNNKNGHLVARRAERRAQLKK